MEQTIELPGTIMTLYRKSLKGSLFGDCNPTTDIPRILGLYQSGDIKLDEIITRTYTLDQVNEGYDDLLSGQERPRRRRPLAQLTRSVGSTRESPRPVLDRAREVELLVAALDGGAHVLLEGPPGTGKSTLLRAVATDRVGAVPPRRGQRRADARRGWSGTSTRRRCWPRGTPPTCSSTARWCAALRERRAAVRRGDQPGPRGDAQRPDHGDVRGRADRAAARAGARRAGLPAGRRDEPVRRGRHRADLLGDLRPHLPDRDGLPVRGDRGGHRGAASGRPTPRWRARVVDLVRRTRAHPDVRIGSSVRGAIDLVAIATRLAAMRGVPADDWQAGLDAALVSLSGRIRMHESAGRRPEDVVRELYEQVFGAPPASPEDAGEGADPGEA